MNNKQNILFWVILLFANIVFVKQVKSQFASKELQFINYLVSTDQNSEALYLINKHYNTPKFIQFGDSLNLLKGKVYYKQQLLNESIEAFSSISKDFSYYLPVRLLQAYEYSHLGNYSESSNVLLLLHSTDSLTHELIKFQKASLSLLNYDVAAYNAYKINQDTSYNQLLEAQLKLNTLAFKLEHHKDKSPLLAGIMSAVIPGSGKMYTGKIGEGVTSLLGMTILGAITYENYRKEGLDNYKTIIFGSLFTVFYAGNIFGSVYSVKVYRDEFNKSIKHAVLFNMHIPIRTIFPDIF